MTDLATEIIPAAKTPILRSFALDDLVVRADGDGRTVEAYAAVFNTPTEIKDFDGHYLEVIDRAAFNGAINRGSKVGVLFNHGRDIYGNPSDRYSMPIGTPESIKADTRGLHTVTRIAKTPLGDEVLELMRSGAIDGFSFSGRPIRSQRQPAGSGLPTILRTELSLREYGPAVFRAYDDARVLAVRAEDLADTIGQLPPDEVEHLVEVLRSRIPASPADDAVLPARADDDFQRRQMAARLRGLLP